MPLLEFFKRNKKTKTETVKTEKPSPEQILFANTVLEIINPTVEQFGFARHRTEVEKHSSTIVWRKDTQYIKVKSSNYPTDYPYFYNVMLGEGSSDDFFEYDWNALALWRMKSKIKPAGKAKEYTFPFGDKVKFSVSTANKELIEYGKTFLCGDLALFLETRSELNKNREPYKIYTPDENGNHIMSYEPLSMEQKKKYS